MAASRSDRRATLQIVVAVAGLVILAVSVPRSAAKQPSSQPTSVGDVFDADLVKESALAKLREAVINAPSSRPCRIDKTKFTVLTRSTDDTASDRARGDARKMAIADVLRRAGVRENRFSVESAIGSGADGTVSVQYEQADDTSPPVVTITPQLKQVRTREIVNFKLEAKDNATGWETGVKSIQLRNLTTQESWASPTEWGRRPSPCDASTMTRPFGVPYTVPENPPLLIRFEGLAEDYGGRIGGVDAVLTTGEFSGRYEWTYESETLTGAAAGDKETQTGVANFSLARIDETNLRGEMFGLVRHAFAGPCPPRLLSEGSFRASIAAQYVTGRLSIPDTPLAEVIRYPRVRLCNDYNDEVDWVHTNYLGYLYEAFQRLQPHDDLGQRAHRPPTPQRTNKGVHSATYTLTVWRRRN